MIDVFAITSAVEDMLDEHTADYTITRNDARNEDPNVAAKGNGWIGIWSGDEEYEAYCTGPNPWLVNLDITIEVQYAHFSDAKEAEDQIERAKNEILGIIGDHPTLDGTVTEITGIRVNRERNQVAGYHYAAVITVRVLTRG